MSRSIVLSGILVAALLCTGAPATGQAAADAHLYLPWVTNAPLAQSAQASGLTLKVTKFTDSADGVCDADCSLREAVTVANQTPGADTITLSSGVYQLTIPPELDDQNAVRDDENNAISDLNIWDNLSLTGVSTEATTITSAMHQRVLKVLAGATVRLKQLTITGGHSEQDGGSLFNAGELSLENVQVVGNVSGDYWATSGAGGGIYNVGALALYTTTITNNNAFGGGGGLFNTGTVTLENVRVTGNAAGGFSGGSEGGGIYNTGQLTVHSSQISQNSTNSADSGYGSGGGIHNTGVLKVYNSLIQENQASGYERVGVGGGVSNSGDTLILNSTISSNVATGDGGGLYSNGAGSLVTLQNSTVSENQSSNGGSGGGLWNSGGSTMTLFNTTVSGNRSSYNGGGINNTRNAGLFTMLNSTIANNHADGNGGGLWNDENSTLTYHNTIIGGNTAAMSGADCQNEATLTSQGHNLVGNSTGCASSAAGDLTVDPTTVFLHILQSLKVNAPGQTATHALLPGSPASDAGDDTVCPTTDQRGMSRPQGAHCDIGAYEGVLQQGLVSWWQAEGNAKDTVGGNQGVLQNHARFALGLAGQAFALDGVDDWVMVPSSPSLNLGTRDFAIAFWVNFAKTDNEQVLIEKFVETFSNPGVPRRGWSLTKLSDQVIRLAGPLDTPDVSLFDTPPLEIPTKQWIYVALTRQKDRFTLYWNGQAIANQVATANLDSEATLKIGHRGNPSDTLGSVDDRGFYLNGCVDEVQLFNHALSSQEIAAVAALSKNQACSPAKPTSLFVSSSSSGKAGNVKFRDEDIVAYDQTTNTWQMVFDGSDVGVTKDVDAFAFLPNGHLLLSFNAPTNLPGLGKVDDSDIVEFIPTELGEHTAGTFAWYLRGSDVGLTTDGEDIDAIGFTPDGHLVVSTIGDFNTPTASGRDEDLFELDNATFGNPTSGTWKLYFDGSKAGLANEDVNGVWIDPANGELYLTVKDSFAFNGVHVDANDIFVCTLTADAACGYQPFWDGDAHAYGSKHLDGISLDALPPTFKFAVQADAIEQATDADTAADDDADDVDIVEGNSNQLFLPLIHP